MLEELDKKFSGRAVPPKGGLTKMRELFQKNLNKSSDSISFSTEQHHHHQQQQDIKLLSFGNDFSEKLRQNNFKIQTPTKFVEKDTFKHFDFVEQKCFKIVDVKQETQMNITPQQQQLPNEFSRIRLLLIECVISGLDVIWPALQENDLHDLQQQQQLGVDEVDNAVVQTRPIELPQKFAKAERFSVIMGPQPVLCGTFVDENGITVEIISSTRPKRIRKDNSIYRPLTKDRSLRFGKRANLIINIVRRERILTFFKVNRIVSQAETEEGYEYQVDKKSILNVIRVVISEGFIKAYKVIISKQEQCFICSLDVEVDDVQLKDVIDSLKRKLLLPTSSKHDKVSVTLVFHI